MKTIVLGIALAISAAALADEGAKKATKAKAPVMTNAADMKFTAPEGTPAGIQMAPLWGDMSKGAYGVMTKFAAGVKNPLHWHTNDVKVVIVKGTFLAGPDDVSAKEYGPGSYLFIPGGKKHVSGCKEGAECLLFQEGPAKFDLIPAGGTQATK